MINIVLLVLISFLYQETQVYLPFNSPDRSDISKIHLTKIGQFGLMRKARPAVPEHYHTGIDIMRPENNYESEPIYPIANGKVISRRTDGPYANLILEHEIKGIKLWTLYEHIVVNVKVGENVNPNTKIARYMNKDELNRYGWQFDHFHLEILKIKPKAMKPSGKTPDRYFESYTLVCYQKSDLDTYYYNPIDFLRSRLKK